MQGYGKQLTLKEIAAVVTYERNAWGNNTGDAVQAADVNAASGGAAASVTDTAEKAVEDVKTAVRRKLQKWCLRKIYLRFIAKMN